MLRIALVAFSTLLAFTACTENELGNLNDGDEVGGRIQVAPAEILYGTLRDGEEDIRQFQITNVGDAGLVVEDLRLEGSASFVLMEEISSFVLPPGAMEEIDVLFTPMFANDQIAHVTVFSDDPISPEEDVDLLGNGAVPELEIDPDDYAFGADFVGCASDAEILLRNVGADDLIITAIDYNDPDGQLFLDDPNSLPVTLAPGGTTAVFVDFESTAEVAATGTLSVTSNDPRGVVTATQSAEGIFATTAEDLFVVPEDPPVDILFAVDQSCSMDAHSAQLATAFSQLIGAIQSVTGGWQIGVVTADSGCFNSGVLDTGTSNLNATFQSAVTFNGTSMAYTEKLFQLTQIAMSKTWPGQCNQNFIRPNALLHVVLVSDEWEQSGISPSSFVSTLQTYKAAPELVKVSGIICGPAGCGHYDGSDTYYKDAITQTNGVRLDVMATNWSNHASQLAAASLSSINRFGLSSTAAASSIRVYVDGVEWTTGWHYEPGTNEVVFDTNPPQGADLSIEYGVLVPCN